jgi:hypothetical protein
MLLHKNEKAVQWTAFSFLERWVPHAERDAHCVRDDGFALWCASATLVSPSGAAMIAMIMIVGCRNAFLRFYESILSTFA